MRDYSLFFVYMYAILRIHSTAIVFYEHKTHYLEQSKLTETGGP